MKQKAVFIGNCQCSGILELLKFTSFYDKYDVKQYANWQMIKNKDAPPIKDIQTADLIVYQPLRDEYGCYSTKKENSNSMFHEVRDCTDLISFPRIHNNSLWPLYHITNSREKFYGNEFLKYYYDQQVKTKNEFMYLYDNMLLDFRFDERFNNNIEISIRKEEATDIKVVNFLEANLKKYRLFLTQDHPTTRVFEHCANYIINKLDLNVTDYHIDDIDENITKLKDSTYNFIDMKYPDSSYSLHHFNYYWNNDGIDNFFYRKNLEDILMKNATI